MVFRDKDFAEENCPCGKSHRTSIKKIEIGSGCLKSFSASLEELGIEGKTAAVYDSNTVSAERMVKPRADFEIVLPAENLHANEHGVALLEEKLPEDVAVIAAVGSGTVHDIVRFVAAKRGLPFVSCPTAATVDGFASSVAAMTWKGFKKTMPAVAPVLILADTDVIAAAPKHLYASGIGDLLGKHIALAEWKIAHLLTGEYYCPTISGMMAKALHETESAAPLLSDGDGAAFEKLMYGLILSGVAMQLAGNSRPASGAEHHISHFIEVGVLCKCDAMHGEKVGVATPICAQVYHGLAHGPHPKSEKLSASPLSEQQLRTVFKEIAGEVIKENENCCIDSVTSEAIEKNWDGICSIIAEIPTAEQLFATLESCGAKKTLSDIGVDEKLKEELCRLSPYIRNRLTLMRIRSVYGL